MEISVYDTNETMKIIGNNNAITFDSDEGKAVVDIIKAMGLEMNNENVMLACHALSIGKIYGIRQERNRRAKKSGK